MNLRYQTTTLQTVGAEKLSAPALVVCARPKNDESYLGFLLRLAEINFYDTPRWIVELANLRPSGLCMCTRAGRTTVNLRLAALTKVKTKDLDALVYHSVADEYVMKVFGHNVEPYLLGLDRPKVCAKCLSQSNYCRKQWEFSAVTSCPIHNSMLLEKCPACKKRLTWFRKGASNCPCGADWRQAQTAYLPESDSVVSRLIYQEFGLIERPHTTGSDNPLYAADLNSLLSALFLVASQEKGRSVPITRTLLLARSSTEIHRRLLRAFAVFENWPINFHQFLDQLSGIKKSSRSERGLRATFGSFHRRLYDPRSTPPAIWDTLRKQFEDYISEYWDRGYVYSAKWFKAKCKSKCISRAQASKILNIDPLVIDGLISSGALTGVVRNTGGRRHFLVVAASVERFKFERGRHLSLRDASKLLGLSKLDVIRLIENSLLTAVQGPSVDHRETWKFDQTSLNEFVGNMLSRTVKPTLGAVNSLRTFSNVLDTLTVRLSSIGWGIHAFVKDILSGFITPIDQSPSKPGLSCLLFSRQDVELYVKNALADEAECLQLEGGIAGHGFKAKTLYFLARKGLIETKREKHGRLKLRIITRDAIRRFESSYVPAGRVARELSTRSNFLIRVLMSHQVYPVSGKSVDAGPQYIFRRADIASLNLKELIRSFPTLRMDKRKQSRSIDSAEAANILSVRKEVVSDLVRNGVLKPCVEFPRKRDKYLFNRTYIKGHERQFRDLAALLSLNAAAQLLNISVKVLRERWLKKDYLVYEISKDGKKKFLRRSEVERIASFTSAVVSRGDAAALLDLPWWRIQALESKGKLKPIANPYPRALGNQIYLKADVKNLRGHAPAYSLT